MNEPITQDWKEVATEMFHEACRLAHKYDDLKELKLLEAGKAYSLSELLEQFGERPKPKAYK